MKAIHTTCWSVVGVILVAVIAPTILLGAPIDGPILNPANGHTYYLLENSNWTDAQSQALSLGGNLATVDDAAENTWIYQTFSDFGGAKRDLWIGLNAIGGNGANPSSYHWVDGSTSAYRNWATGEPIYSTDLYTFILPGGYPDSGRWNNGLNTTVSTWDGYSEVVPNHGVVEVVPEPSTYLSVLLGSFLLWSGMRLRSNRHSIPKLNT